MSEYHVEYLTYEIGSKFFKRFNWYLKEFKFWVSKTEVGDQVKYEIRMSENSIVCLSVRTYDRISIIDRSNESNNVILPKIEYSRFFMQSQYGFNFYDMVERGLIKDNIVNIKIELSKTNSFDFNDQILIQEKSIEPKFKYVLLDIGGCKFTTSSQTLLNVPGTYFTKLIDPQFDKRSHEFDPIIIDRDGSNFGIILEYLRDPIKFDVKELSADARKSIKRDVDFYNLTDLGKKLDSLNDYSKGIVRIFNRDGDLADFIEKSARPVIILNSKSFSWPYDLSGYCSENYWIVVRVSEYGGLNVLYVPKLNSIVVTMIDDIDDVNKLREFMIKVYSYLLHNP